MTDRALFRVDAGPGIGLGHLQRSTALAHALAARAVEVTLLTPALEVVGSKAALAGYELVPLALQLDGLGTAADLEQTLDTARQRESRFVVVDSYRAGRQYLEALRAIGLTVVVFDDLADAPTPAHVLINGAVGAEERDYRSTTGDTVFLLGPRYAALQPGFRDAPQRQARPLVAHVLVAVGGADPHGVLRRLVEWLDELPARFEMDAVVGPFAETPAFANAFRHPVRFRRAPDGLDALMHAADLVVCGAGQTLYEAAASGAPTVAIKLFDNQEPTYCGFLASGAVRGGGAIGDSDLRERVVGSVRELLEDPAARASLGRAGRQLVDGRGAERVADRMMHGS